MNEEVRLVIEKASKLSYEENDREAEELVNAALSKHPRNLGLKTMLGILKARLGRERESEVILRSVLKRNPTYEMAASALGHLLDNSLRTNEAEQLYKSVLRKDPSKHCIVDDLCRLLIDESRIEEALVIGKDHAQSFQDEYKAYDALRYTLACVEDELDIAVDESGDEPKQIVKCILNLLHQLEVLREMNNSVSQDEQDAANLTLVIEDETLRIKGKMSDLEDLLDKLGHNLNGKITAKKERLLQDIPAED